MDFLKSTLQHYQALGPTIKRLLTDNGEAYSSQLFASRPTARPGASFRPAYANGLIAPCEPNSAKRTGRLPAFLVCYNARLLTRPCTTTRQVPA